MSKGSPIVPIRFPAELLKAMDVTIHRQNRKRVGEPWTRSSWILHAICEKLDHIDRARRPRKRRTGQTGPATS